MRLLLTADTIGGVWTFSCELTRELLTRGHQVLLVSFGGAPSESQLLEIADLSKSGLFSYTPSETPLEWQPNNHNAYISGASLLLRLCETFRPNALLLGQFCFGALPVSVPKVVVAHSDVLSWSEAVRDAPPESDDWLRTYCTLVQTGLHGADLIVAPTAAMMRGLQKHFQVHAETRIIPNGRTLPLPSLLPTKELRAVTAGRLWDPAKNIALLYAADLPLPVVIAGAVDADTVGTDQITWIGQIASAALVTLFLESAIYICCSRYEPFGLAAMEAALCGCAVLANDIPSLREVWGESALYFKDASTLSALLRSLRSDTMLLKAAQARSTERAKQYSSTAMVEGYLQALGSLLPSCSEAARAA